MAMFLTIPNQRKTKIFRENIDYLDSYTDEELRLRFRFGKESIQYISNLLHALLQRKTHRNKAISTQLQVLITLRFFASGSFLQVIGDTFRIDKSTVSYGGS